MSGHAVWAPLRVALLIGLGAFSFAAGCSSGGSKEHHTGALVRCGPGIEAPGCAKGGTRLARAR